MPTTGGSEIDLVGLADVILTAALAAIGLYLAHSVSRQVGVRVAEKRLKAYSSLWAAMRTATPVRDWMKVPLTVQERKRLFLAFVDWYYADGNGMLLSRRTRRMFYRAKDNLVCEIKDYKPEPIRNELESIRDAKLKDQLRSQLSIRQLSMLRARMRADLHVYGSQYAADLNEFDIAFLNWCGERLYLRPWARWPLVPREQSLE